MVSVDQLKDAVRKAQALESKLDPACFEIGGFTSPCIRHLMNNLGALSTRYLEIGVHRGATFVSSLYKNLEIEQAVAIDNFSEFNESGDIKSSFLQSMETFKGTVPTWTLIDRDCWSDKTWSDLLVYLKNPVDLYLYDGAHDYESQYKAIAKFTSLLKKQFILCVDDYDWKDVARGTEDAIKDLQLEIVTDIVCSGPDWHNGFAVFLLNKPLYR